MLDLPQASQPTSEDLEKMGQQDKPQKGKKISKKQQWGPVMPLRRSARNVDDGRVMLDKAQDFKRKWNLEDNAGKKKKTNVDITAHRLTDIAKEVGITLEDGNPDLVNQLINIDKDRCMTSKLECKHSSCCSSSTGVVRQEESSKQPHQEASTPKHTRISDASLEELELEQGWSKVGPRKKNRRKKK